jgi:Family of unknown function (DUF6585)
MTQPGDAHDEAQLQQRAQGGDVWAMSMLGFLLSKRKATKKEALSWWRRAAQAGDVYSMECLAANLRSSREEEEGLQWAALASATRRGQGTEPVPAEVTTAARDADLGNYKAIFGPQFGVGDFMPRPTVWVFDRGFVSRDYKSGQLTVFPWGRSRVFRFSIRILRNNMYVKTEYEYRVTRDDGAELTMKGGSRFSGEVWVLGELIDREISKVRLPRAVTAIREGKRLDFGPLSMDQGAIFDGQDTLPWQEVEAITVEEGKLVIRRVGGWLAWSKTHTHKIPDLQVLLTLAHAIHKAARSAG